MSSSFKRKTPLTTKVQIPGFFGMPFGTELDWNFHSVPQDHVNNTILSYPRGRMLGGSSGLNFMLWNR
jgi:choline dehydrogenase-like flavoprotein